MTLGADARLGQRHGLADLARSSSTPSTAHVEDAVAKGARVLTGGRARPDLGPYFFEPTDPRGRHPRHDLLRPGDLRPGGRRSTASTTRPTRWPAPTPASTASTPRSTARTAPGPARSPARSSCGTVNVNEAFAATFASIDAPMGGMRESGMGRRQGGEGILRYTETQSVATQRLMRFAPDARHVRGDLREGDDREPPADEEARDAHDD